MTSQVLINEKGFQRILQGHPWIFRSDITDAPHNTTPGEIVFLHIKNGKFLGQAFFNPLSQISLRLLTRNVEPITTDFWRKRLQQAIQRRHHLGFGKYQARRLVFGEADFLPGFVVDQYRDVIVFQTLCAGIERVKEQLLALLKEELKPVAIVERNDVSVRELEGLVKQKGVIFGSIPNDLEVQEGVHWFDVDPLEGQKTGLFLDQSENHQVAGRYAHGRVLDGFAYQGGFSLAVAPTSESVLAVDSSASALEIFKKNVLRNEIKNIQIQEANVFDFLREAYDRGEKFNTVILDPPPFMKSKKNIRAGLAGYKEINLRAMKILEKEGILITSSCSQNFTPDLFQSVLEESARDAKRHIHILEIRGPSADHPILMGFPESHYLQCWILRVI